MRLTLRTLLAYLDDTLEPAEAKQIGLKVAESDIAQELIERIKQLTRRHRLTAPPATGPGAKLDPNTIADYLDNILSPEKLAEVEEICLTSDVHLAEIASCHQILTLVLGEPAKIPPTARRRMIALNRGRDSLKRRPAAAAVQSPDALNYDALDADEDEALLLGMPFFLRHKSWVRWALPLAGVLLLGIILGVAFSQFPSRNASEPVTQRRSNRQIAENSKGRPDAVEAKKPSAAAPGDAKPPDATSPAAAPPPEAKPAPPVEVPPIDAKPNSATEAKPALPAATRSTEPSPVETTPATPSTAAKSDDMRTGPPRQEVKDIGRFATMGSVLLQRPLNRESWQYLLPESQVKTMEPLVSLPGYRSEIRLDSGVRLELWGSLGEAQGTVQMMLESAVVLYVNPAVDLDFQLQYGRVRLTNHKPNGPARVRVRFFEEIWDLTLNDGQTEIVLQLWGDDPLNHPEWPANPRRDGALSVVDLFLLKGSAHIRDGQREHEMVAPCSYYWHSVFGGSPRPLDLREAPKWATELPQLKPGVRPALEKLSKRLNKEKSAIDVALASTLKEKDLDPTGRILAVFCLGAIGDVAHLLDAVEDGPHPEVRATAAVALRHWLGRGPGQERKLEEAIQKKYSDAVQPKQVLYLLRPLSDTDRARPETYNLLIEYLLNDRAIVRELASEKLRRLAPHIAEEIPYDAAGSADQRQKAYSAWKSKVPDGKMPPPPKTATPPNKAAR